MLRKFLPMCLLLGGCFETEYSENYISVNETDFEHYKNEAKERPSPPNRASVILGETKVYITYSQPGVKGRKIWGQLVEYDKVWRTGANEATVFSTTGDVLVNGDTVSAGNYALYTIPTRDKWVVILNAKYDVWGAYDYEREKDILRFEVSPLELPKAEERMAFNIDRTGKVNFVWEKLGFYFQVSSLN